MHGSSFMSALFRKKTFEGTGVMASQMKRVLTVVDVTSLAVGQMIGAGIYVLTGSVVRNIAGPSIVVSFLLAGIAALFSAFSYAEFGARYPRAGSAYTYAYVGVGEVWAFVIGWTVLLEYMIGNAAVARSWSGYFDKLLNNAVSNFTLTNVGSISDGTGFFGHYPDVLAFLLICFVSVFVAMGSKSSSTFNNFFVFLNLTVIGFVTVVGFTLGDFKLWVGTDEAGVSRFVPFGLSGTLAGAATVFFSFIGFEALATAGEEAKNPQTTIPLATFSSLAITTVVYILMAASLTVMFPYDQIDPEAAFAAAFQAKGANYAMYIVTIGALIGMMNSLISGSFCGPRAFYAMADDGLIFSFIAKVNSVTKVPVNSIVVFTVINAAMALVFDLEALVEFLSIGTLMAYSFVSACVIILRHQPAPIDGNQEKMDCGGNLYRWVPFRNYWESMPEGRSICVAVIGLIISQFWLAANCRLGMYTSIGGRISLSLSILSTIVFFIFIMGHEQNRLELSYKVPFVPYIPSLSLLINIFMMAYLNGMTWIRMFVWMIIGLLIYIFYGFHHSKEGIKRRSIREAVSRAAAK